MNEFRISKYNPKYRIDGVYSRNEWTEKTDIGEKFGGVRLTKKKYLAVSERYIRCILEIVQRDGRSQFQISDLEWTGIRPQHRHWRNGQQVYGHSLARILRECLDGKYWCRLYDGQAFIHFGYDFYVYIGCALSRGTVEEICREHRLFLEERSSPYSMLEE